MDLGDQEECETAYDSTAAYQTDCTHDHDDHDDHDDHGYDHGYDHDHVLVSVKIGVSNRSEAEALAQTISIGVLGSAAAASVAFGATVIRTGAVELVELRAPPEEGLFVRFTPALENPMTMSDPVEPDDTPPPSDPIDDYAAPITTVLSTSVVASLMSSTLGSSPVGAVPVLLGAQRFVLQGGLTDQAAADQLKWTLGQFGIYSGGGSSEDKLPPTAPPFPNTPPAASPTPPGVPPCPPSPAPPAKTPPLDALYDELTFTGILMGALLLFTVVGPLYWWPHVVNRKYYRERRNRVLVASGEGVNAVTVPQDQESAEFVPLPALLVFPNGLLYGWSASHAPSVRRTCTA